MKVVAFSLEGLWWLSLIVVMLVLLFWQRHRLSLSPLRWAAFSLLLAALLNPLVMLQLKIAQEADFNLQMVKPRILLVEYGGGRTFLGTVLGAESINRTDVVSPENLPLVADMIKRYDVVTIHATKNLQVYTNFFTDWRPFPNRSKLESVFTE